MLLTIFSGLYELIAGSNPDVPDYDERVYDTVGQITVVFVFALVLIYYPLLGRWKPIFYTLSSWIITLMFAIGISFAIAFFAAEGIIGDIDIYMYRFSLMNSVFAAVVFFILSVIFKGTSIYTKRTPF